MKGFTAGLLSPLLWEEMPFLMEIGVLIDRFTITFAMAIIFDHINRAGLRN
ncbi:MAG TPA: hypothetical protein VGZ47_07220 [Gemmataceae bacterium]|jgi:hypothetical protein|nr:hypothetical protein [Gemmataceae bacterium]